MEPLSAVASVIAVVGLAAKVCRTFAELRSLCKTIPGHVHAVNNEVTDLELVLRQLGVLIQDRGCLPEGEDSLLPHLLFQARAKLEILKAVITRLVDNQRESRFQIKAANAWRKEQDRLRSLQDDIKTIKCSLNLVLGASNSRDMLRIRLDIDTISAVAAHSSQEQEIMSKQIQGGIAAVDDRIAKVEELLRAQSNRLQVEQDQQVGTLYNTKLVRRRRPNHQLVAAPPSKELCEGISVRVTPFATCRSGCPCACHLEKKMSTPALLDRVIGQFFVGYSGLPILSPKCSIETCQKSQSSQVSLEYWFPFAYLSSTIVRLQLGYQPNLGTLFQLDTLRRVPDTAQCVNFALSGNIEGLKYLFRNGLASPRDVSPTRGYSLLRWALYGKQYETCIFLMNAGADPTYKPIAAEDNNPRNKACHFLLEGSYSEIAGNALRTIAKGGYYDDFIDEARFTQTHRIVLQLSLLDLDEEIRAHPDDINIPDAMGRTPLAWAAARGDTRAIVTLLSHGADPNIIDVQLSGAVSNAAAQGHTVAVRLLLEAGAHPDPPLPPGVKKGSPLNCAARNATDTLLLKTLLDFGADTESRTVDGRTPLIDAARTNNSSFALLLLECGANINAASISGATPLTAAIINNSHSVLKLILDRWQEYTTCPRLQSPHLLQIAAQYADITTIDALASVEHFDINYDKDYILGDFKSLLVEREDATEDLIKSFDNLLGVIGGERYNQNKIRGRTKTHFFGMCSSPETASFEDIVREVNAKQSTWRAFEDSPERLETGELRSPASANSSEDQFEDARELLSWSPTDDGQRGSLPYESLV